MLKRISWRFVIGFALQWVWIPALWLHISDGGTVFGRYSSRYALVLALNIALIVVFGLAWLFQQRVIPLIERLPKWTTMILTGSIALALWTQPFELQILGYISLNWVWLVALLTPDMPLERPRYVVRVWAVVVVLMLVLMFVTTLGINTYQPDEGHYADIATSFWSDGHLYNKSWLSPQYRVEPGLSWFFVVYGGLLELIGYSVRVGRTITVMGYLLYFAGVYAVTSRLYGRTAAVISTALATVSLNFLPEWDYRPSRFVLTVGIWLFYLLIRAREDSDAENRVPTGKLWMDGAIGLLMILAFNLHPISIVIAAAFSLFYALEFVWRLWRERNWRVIYPVVAFGVGALIGTGVYWVANVMAAGGAEVYLGRLSQSTQNYRPTFFFISRWHSPLEQIVIVSSVGYLLWRRTAQDRLLLAMLALTVLTAYNFDTQGYVWHVGAFYFVPIGAAVVGVFSNASIRTWAVSSALLLVLIAQGASTFINWQTISYTLQTGTLPTYLYDELKTVLPQYVTEDDVIYSTHQLIWVFPHTGKPNVVSYAAERNAVDLRGYESPVDVWEDIQPTVLIHIEDHMIFDVGMQAYMQRHPFDVCETLTVQGKTIKIYRENCETFFTNAR